jgi:hypothetical protein
MSCPSKTTRPEVGVSSRVAQRASVDLPQPVSPTRAERLPAADLEADPVDRVDRVDGRREPAVADRKALDDVLEAEQHVAAVARAHRPLSFRSARGW